MNPVRTLLLILAAVFVALWLLSPRRPLRAFRYLRTVILLCACALMLAPFFWLLCSAFKDKDVLMKYSFLPPPGELSAKTVNLSNFHDLFAPQDSLQGKVWFWQFIINSLFLASAQTIIQLFFSSLGGYALAKYEFRGKRFVMFFMLGSMMIPAMLLMAPVYDLIFKLGWMDSYLALIVPSSVSVFGMFLFRQAILGIPDDIIEAGRVEGAGEFRIYLHLIMPLVRPMSAAFCLVAFLGSWNSFIAPNVFLQTHARLTLPVVLNFFVSEYVNQYGIFLAGTLLAIIPPAILFFSLQKEFVSGLTSGAVKG